MKSDGVIERIPDQSRVPHGTRGLKCSALSLLARALSRVPHGTRGLKWKLSHNYIEDVGRVPHGTRGLKYVRRVERTLF